jgi:hypothetical protein
MLGSSHAGERDNVISAIKEILLKHGHSWNDLPELLQSSDPAQARSSGTERDEGEEIWQDIAEPSDPVPLERILAFFSEYIQLQEHEYLAVALWIAHTYVYDRFMVSPRLALISPVRRCGKTTAIDVLTALCCHGDRFDSLSAAAIYRLIDSGEITLLCDEVDTYNLHKNELLRGVFNSGHRRGGRIGRASRDGVTRYSSYAPMALAVIGPRSLPLTVLDRSILVRMTRRDRKRRLQRFDPLNAAISTEIDAIQRELKSWSRGAVLNGDPELPPELHDRAADNWRPLVAIADAAGNDWGIRARGAAVALSAGLQHEDPGVILLRDIREVLDSRAVDRIFSQVLVEALVAMEGRPWAEWRGIKGNLQPRALTQATLAQVLHDFDIAPASVWPIPRLPTSKSRKGYHRRQFEEAWRAYCDREDEENDSRVRVLRSA